MSCKEKCCYYIENHLIELNESLNRATPIYDHYLWRNRVSTDIKCTIWFLYYKFHVLLKFLWQYHMVSLWVLPFVMPNKLKLYYISIYCCECLKTFVLSTLSLIRYQLFFTLRPQNILNWFWIYLVHAKGLDPNFSVKGLLASVLRAILFLTILWCSWLGIPLCHLFGWKAGINLFQTICRDFVAVVLDLINVNKNDLETSYLENELLYKWS